MKILVVGVGGGGCNAVNRMIQTGSRGVEFIAVNTDAQALHHSDAPTRLRIGEKLTSGLGAGGNPSIGERAAEESAEELFELCTAPTWSSSPPGMGGGTGTGAAPVVAEIAREMRRAHGRRGHQAVHLRGHAAGAQSAEEGIAQLKREGRYADHHPQRAAAAGRRQRHHRSRAFTMADDVLRQGIQGISDLITEPGLINLDFADVKTIMSEAGAALMAIGARHGDNRAVDAARMAISSPLLTCRSTAPRACCSTSPAARPDAQRDQRGGRDHPGGGRPRRQHHLRRGHRPAHAGRGQAHRHRHRLRRRRWSPSRRRSSPTACARRPRATATATARTEAPGRSAWRRMGRWPLALVRRRGTAIRRFTGAAPAPTRQSIRRGGDRTAATAGGRRAALARADGGVRRDRAGRGAGPVLGPRSGCSPPGRSRSSIRARAAAGVPSCALWRASATAPVTWPPSSSPTTTRPRRRPARATGALDSAPHVAIHAAEAPYLRAPAALPNPFQPPVLRALVQPFWRHARPRRPARSTRRSPTATRSRGAPTRGWSTYRGTPRAAAPCTCPRQASCSPATPSRPRPPRPAQSALHDGSRRRPRVDPQAGALDFDTLCFSHFPPLRRQAAAIVRALAAQL